MKVKDRIPFKATHVSSQIAGRRVASVGGARAAAFCKIDIPNCSANPSLSGSFVEAASSTMTNLTSCADRAEYWHNYCGTDVATSSFWSRGSLIGKTTYQTACQVAEDSCAPLGKTSAAVFTALDLLSHSSPVACMSQAALYQSQCKSNASAAAFYVNGKLVQTQRYPQISSCMINQPICEKATSSAGSFQDTNVLAIKT